MRYAKRLTALILAMLLCASQLPAAMAAGSEALDALMADVLRPVTHTLEVNPPPAEGSGAIQKTVTVNFAGGDGQSAQAIIALSFEHFSKFDATWQERADSYAELVAKAAASAQRIDPERFSAQLNQAIDAMHQYNERLVQAELGEDDPVPTALVLSVSVTAPYYETLQRGSRGDAVVRLQQKLIELGFLDGEADGQFGKGTAEGVRALQAHVLSLEQEQIDLMPEPTPMPAKAVAPAEDGTELEPTPTPIPVKKPSPVTELDGIAGPDLQAYLFSDSFSIASAELAQGDQGAPVRRLQNRLILLGYMVAEPDGDYGPGTARAVRTFQHYSGLTEDAIATREVQLLLYSADAQRPPYPMLTQGSSGAEVRTLQQRLKLLGFMVGEVDGTYGPSTVRGVKKLQEYLLDREMQRLAQEAAANSTPSPEPVESVELTSAADKPNPIVQAFRYLSGGVALAEAAPQIQPYGAATQQPTIVVDGVCDPMLQEMFYADDFPVFPGMMKAGAKGLDVERLQRRLYDLEYLFINADGDYGDNTVSAVTEFQGRNALSADGVAGADTIRKIFSEGAKKALKPYVLKISTSKQRVYAYAPDENEEYTRLVRTMICSTGRPATPTPKGTFQAGTGPGARWHYFKKFKCWAQYAYYIQGDIMFHSVLYGSKGGRVTSSSVYNLGSKASHGCVRLKVEDAKWIWSNCPPKTKIVVY